jgi:hypothetical protein
MDKKKADKLTDIFLKDYPSRASVSVAVPEFVHWLYAQGYEIKPIVTAPEDVIGLPVPD